MEQGNAVRIIRHPRARRLRLRFDLAKGQAVLTMPVRVSQREALAFIATQQEWLAAQRARLVPVINLVPGAVLPIFGISTRLERQPEWRGRPLWSDGLVRIGGRPEHFSRRICAAVREQGEQVFLDWVNELSGQLGLAPLPRVQLRDTRSRWGSCTAQGDIRLSWRLAFAPAAVARYVVAHEVAHRRELNHSPRFWAIVNDLVGDCRMQRQWLRQHGHGLLRIGVAELPQGSGFL